jgi:hypothetical protein
MWDLTPTRRRADAHALPAVILSMLLLFIIKVRRVDSIWFVLTRTEN